MKIKYTIEDCFVLNILINSREGSFNSLDFYDEVIAKARETIMIRELKENEIEELIRTWIFKRHSLDETYTITEFIFKIEFNKVALFINEEILKIFVEWRLKIAK
jgi:hypothetical protein